METYIKKSATEIEMTMPQKVIPERKIVYKKEFVLAQLKRSKEMAEKHNLPFSRIAERWQKIADEMVKLEVVKPLEVEAITGVKAIS